jgi:hypothetical protein
VHRSPNVRARASVALLLAGAFAVACVPPGRAPSLGGSREAPPPGPLLKVHLQSGHLLALRAWEVEGDSAISGSGERYSSERALLTTGLHRVSLDSVALFENSVSAEGANATFTLGLFPLVTFSTIAGFVTVACLVNPKACFGSCPTFYVDTPEGERLFAEGFSASIARVLEARDVDAIPLGAVRAGRIEVTMRNEALETHALRSVRLLAAPRPGAAVPVVATPEGVMLAVDRRIGATACLSRDGDCLAEVAARDGVEWRSWADGSDLAAREAIDLEFPAAEGELALVLTARHTFVSTFLFYQSLAYLGRNAGPVIAALERGDEVLKAQITAPMRELGGLRVSVQDDTGRWVLAATFDEAGPLASDTQALPLPAGLGDGPVRVRLDLVRGYWRLDEVALVVTGAQVEPLVLEPVVVRAGGEPALEAHRRLLDPGLHLATFPGDEYVLAFDVPVGADAYELFLESEGYYYEWMRPEWLAEEDPVAAALLLTRPYEMFRHLAPAFKAQEAGMEEIFWQSRVARREP